MAGWTRQMHELPRARALPALVIAAGVGLVLSQLVRLYPSPALLAAGVLFALAGACWLADR